MEGRTGLPLTATPPYPAPVLPPHGTVPAPVAVSTDTVLSPVFADLPAGPNTNTRSSTAAVTSITSPGHASYQDKLFPCSVAGAGARFAYLGGYASPSSSEPYKQSAVIAGQAVGMNQYWVPTSEGYTGFPVGSGHHYPPYFTGLNSLSGSASPGLLAVSSMSKTADGQRIPASHHTRNSESWEGAVTKMSPHGPIEGALSPKTSGHPPGKARHTSGSDERRSSKHDGSRSKSKDKPKDLTEDKKEATANRRTNPKDKGTACDNSPKIEQRLESDFPQDRSSKKLDRSAGLRGKQSHPLSVCVDLNNAENSSCNGDGVQSPIRDGCAKSIPSASASSPKSKDSASERRKKGSKRKDLSVDVNGNAVLSSGSTVVEKKASILAGDEKAQPSVMGSVLDAASSTKEAICVASTHSPAGTDTADKSQPSLTDLSVSGNGRPSGTNLAVLPAVSSPIPVPSAERLSPSSLSRKVMASASHSSVSPGLSPHGTRHSPVADQSGTSSGTTAVSISSSGVTPSASASDSPQGLRCDETPPTMEGGSVKLNPCVDQPRSVISPGLHPTDTSQHKGNPEGVTPKPSVQTPPESSGTNTAPSAEVNPKGINANPTGSDPVNPDADNPKRSNPVGATALRETPSGSNPLDVRTTDSGIAGANSSTNPSMTNPVANPAEASQSSPTDPKPLKASSVTTASVPACSPNSSEQTEGSPSEKEKGTKSLVSMATFSTCVTSSVSKPISFPSHGSLPSSSSQNQPSYINHLPIYLHGTGHLSLEREIGRETPRDGSKVHATTFVPALGEFIPGPACSATVPVKEPKVKSSSNKDSSLAQAGTDRDKDRASKKEVTKVVSASSKDQANSQSKFDVNIDKSKAGLPHQDGGLKSKESADVKSTQSKGKGDKLDKHDRPKKMHSGSKASHDSRDHHSSPPELSTGGKDRGVDGSHRTSSDLIHRETCRTSDAAIISTSPSVHGYPHHMSGFVLPPSGLVSSRDGGKHEAPPPLYSSEEQRRFLEWHMAAAKRGYCYEHPSIRGAGQEALKVDSSLLQRTPHQPSFPSPRIESRSELTPEHCRGRDYPPYTAPQESMLRSVLTAGMMQAHSDTQRTSPGSNNNSSSNSSKPAKPTSEPKSETRSKSSSHSSKTPAESVTSQGRSTPGTKGSDGRNPPVGIAVAQKRPDSESASQGRTTTISTSRNSPHVSLEEMEERGGRGRSLHSVERDAKHRDHSPRSQREAGELLPPGKYHHHRYPGDLGSNLIVTGGTGLGHSPHHFDRTDGRITPSHPPHLAIPPHWLPRGPGQPHAQSLWLGHPFGLAPPPAASLHGGEGASGHLPMPPAGFQVARDPATGQLVLVPQAPAMHADSTVPPNLSMWPYLVPPHLQPHSHQLQQLVLNQPSFTSPLPHQSSHPMAHRPDQPLPSADYQFALQHQQEALAQWYRQDEQRQREEQRRREQQSRKGSNEKGSSDKIHKSGSGGETKGDGHAEKRASTPDVLNLKIPPPAPYLPGVPLPGQPPVPYVYPPQQVQYLYNPTGVFPGPAVTCNSSPRTESGASTASPKQSSSKSAANSDSSKASKLETNSKTALKSISVQTSPSETPASEEYSKEAKNGSLAEEVEEEEEDKEVSVRTDESEDQELIIVDVVDEDISDNLVLQSEKISRESKEDATAQSETKTTAPENKQIEEEERTVILKPLPPLSIEASSDMNLDPAVTQRTVTETILPIPPLNTPPLETALPPPEVPAQQEETSKDSLLSNVLTATPSFASRMESLDQDQLAAIEGIALLSEVADQKAFSLGNDSEKSSVAHTTQTRDDSYLLDNRHQDNGTPLQGNTASAVTSASGGALQLISQSCPTSPTDFLFKRGTSTDVFDTFTIPEHLMNPNEVEMRQRMAELQRKYQEKKRELDKLQRKKDKKDKGSRCLEQDRQRGPGRPRKRKISQDTDSKGRPCPIIKSSTAVLLEAAASLEESSPFLAPKKKKKKDKDDKEKAKTEEKKKTSRKDKDAKTSHSETSKSKKRKQKSKEETQESMISSEDVPAVSKAKSKLKSKTKSPTPSKDAKTKAVPKSRKLSVTDSASSDSFSRSGKSAKTTGAVRSPRSQNSSTEFDTDSGSIIWPSCISSPSSKTLAKPKSRSTKKKTKDPKTKDSRKTGVRGQGSSNAASDSTAEAIENVIRKSSGSHGNEEKEMPRSGGLQHVLHVYEDDSDSPWEMAMINAKQRRNSSGQAPQKGLALLAGISSQELMRTSSSPLKDSKTDDGTATETECPKTKPSKGKKRSASPVSSDQETSKKARRSSLLVIKREKDFELPSKPAKTPKMDKKKDKTSTEPPYKVVQNKQEKRESEDKPFFNEEIWTRRRSERIFLSDISPGTSRDASPLAKGHDAPKTPKKSSQHPAKSKTHSEGSSSEQGSGLDHNGVANIGSVLDALKTDTLQIRKKLASMSAQEDEKDETPRKTKKKLSKKRDQGKKSKQDGTNDQSRTRHHEDNLDSSCSEAENLPLSNLLDRQSSPAPRSCIIHKDELENGLRVLMPIEGLFYAGYVNAIQPPDVYGVILDGERGNRPHVFSQEQILHETFIDVKPLSTRYVTEGTRVCAYWSQQFRCLYPGTVVKGTPNPNEDPNFVCVEFDDGDSGRIPVDHIRMLPNDFPIVEFEPIPTELQRKRRRRTSEASSSTVFKPESTETSTDSYNASKGKTTPSKKKPKTIESAKTLSENQEMGSITESGEDEVFLPQKVQSKSKKSKNHDKSKKLSSKADSRTKEKKKKKKRKREDRRHESSERKRSKRSSSKSPRRSPTLSPARSPGKSKKKKRKEERKKKSSSKLSSSSGSKSPIFKSKSSKKKCSSSSGGGGCKRKNHRDERHSSFCTVETETVYSVHPLANAQALTGEESASETAMNDAGKGAWSKHRGTRDHSMDECSSSDSSRDSSSDSQESTSESHSSKDNSPVSSSRKSRSSCLPSTSKMTAFLPARQLWNWFGKATQRRGAKGKARKVFYRAIMRENEIIRQGDAAVFLSTGRPQLPYIGRIESMWESWGGNMVVRVKWFYHPEETKGGRKSHDGKMALYQSLHVDENDVQTISHRCEVLSVEEYKRYTSPKKHKHSKDSEDMYYLAGTYDPTSGHITSVT